MRTAKNTTGVLVIVIATTMLSGLIDALLPAPKSGDSVFTLLSILGILGCILTFFVALTACYKADCPEDEENTDEDEDH